VVLNATVVDTKGLEFGRVYFVDRCNLVSGRVYLRYQGWFDGDLFHIQPRAGSRPEPKPEPKPEPEPETGPPLRPEPGPVKHDQGKYRWSMLHIFRGILLGVVRVREFGMRKYQLDISKSDGWKNVPDALRRYMDAMDRHLDAVLLDGEDTDPESGLPHMHHFLCDALFVAWLVANKPDQLAEMRSRWARV